MLSMGLSSRLMDLVGRLLHLGVFFVAQQFAAIAQRMLLGGASDVCARITGTST